MNAYGGHCLLRDLASVQRWRCVVCSRTVVSFCKVTATTALAARGSWRQGLLVNLRPLAVSSGAGGRFTQWQALTSSATWNSDKDERDRAPSSLEKKSDEEYGSVLMEVLAEKKEPKQLTTATKVVQAGKDLTYLFVIVGGFGVLAFLMYMVGSEFFTANSPSSIFTKTLKRVKSDQKVQELLGVPIVGHGEASGRGRRRYIDHLEYIKEGKECMVMKFHVLGKKRKGVVRLDLMKNENGKYECKYLDVELVGYPPGRIVLENNYSLSLTE